MSTFFSLKLIIICFLALSSFLINKLFLYKNVKTQYDSKREKYIQLKISWHLCIHCLNIFFILFFHMGDIFLVLFATTDFLTSIKILLSCFNVILLLHENPNHGKLSVISKEPIFYNFAISLLKKVSMP